MEMEKEVFQQVQAALLNSEGDPRRAVEVALRAVSEFAVSELSWTPTQVSDLAEYASLLTPFNS